MFLVFMPFLDSTVFIRISSFDIRFSYQGSKFLKCHFFDLQCVETKICYCRNFDKFVENPDKGKSRKCCAIFVLISNIT